MRAIGTALVCTGLLVGCAADDGPVGRWDGYLESYELRSGSDRIAIEIGSADPGGAVSGIVVFGEGPAPAPATDPERGWPTDWTVHDVAFRRRPVESFEYEIVGGMRVGDRIQAELASEEPWGEWCAIQTPIRDDDESEERWSCVPNWGFSTDGMSMCTVGPSTTGEVLPVDCVKLQLCNGQTCSCTADGCVVSPSGRIELDLTLEGGALVGSIRGLDAETVRVRLTRR